MNGPQHYAEAERRLLMAWEEDSTQERSTQLVAEANVHALLAMTAAYALCAPICESPNDSGGHPSQDHYDEWVGAVEIGERDYEGVAFGGTTDPSIVSQQNAENAR